MNDWKVVLDGVPHTVVGIMPNWFQLPYRTTMTDVWIPSDLLQTENWSQRIDVGVGRVRPGVTIAAAIAELQPIAQRLQPLAKSNPGRSPQIIPLTRRSSAVLARVS